MNNESQIVTTNAAARGASSASAIADSRYSFTAQFLLGSAIFARRAHELELNAGASLPSEEVRTEHRAYIVGAIVQSAAALESEISEVTQHGPGHHLGSNGIDVAARELLAPMADIIDGEQTLRRYDLVLHLLRRPAMDPSKEPHQSAQRLVKLRNELIHYKSKWGTNMEGEKFFKTLKEELRFEWPGFISEHSGFFPHQCLSASLASWSVTTAASFIDCFYDVLGITNPLKSHAAQLVVPPPRRRTRRSRSRPRHSAD